MIRYKLELSIVDRIVMSVLLIAMLCLDIVANHDLASMVRESAILFGIICLLVNHRKEV